MSTGSRRGRNETRSTSSRLRPVPTRSPRRDPKRRRRRAPASDSSPTVLAARVAATLPAGTYYLHVRAGLGKGSPPDVGGGTELCQHRSLLGKRHREPYGHRDLHAQVHRRIRWHHLGGHFADSQLQRERHVGDGAANRHLPFRELVGRLDGQPKNRHRRSGQRLSDRQVPRPAATRLIYCWLAAPSRASPPNTVKLQRQRHFGDRLGDHRLPVVNWSDGSTANPRTDTAVKANVAATANFTTSAFTVTASAGPNGSISPNTPQSVGQGGVDHVHDHAQPWVPRRRRHGYASQRAGWRATPSPT